MVLPADHLAKFASAAADESAAMDRLTEAEQASVEEMSRFIDAAMAVFDAICEASHQVQTMPEADRDRGAAQVIQMFADFYHPVRRQFDAMGRLEALGHRFARAQEFRWAAADAHAYGLESEKILRGVRQDEDGQTLPLAEAMNELRRVGAIG